MSKEWPFCSGALARDRLGEYQAQAAVAALHANAQKAQDTDWPQIVEWYDELVRLTGSPVARLNRAVAVGEADGARAGLAALAELDPSLPRHTAARAYLHEKNGDAGKAARLYAEAALLAPSLAEREHLTLQAARLNAARRDGPGWVVKREMRYRILERDPAQVNDLEG